MKQWKVEIQVTILTVIIAAAMVASGYYVYQSLSVIIDSINQETRPDFKLLLIKDISSDLDKIENNVRLYSLTNDPSFITPYRKLNTAVQEKLKNLEDYEVPGSGEIGLIDSIRILTNRKLLLWEEIRSLHRQRGDTHDRFSDLYAKIDTSIIQPDTIIIPQKEEKKGFLKRIFGKKDTTAPKPIVINNAAEKENLKQEIALLENQISTSNKKFQSREKALLEQDIQISSQLSSMIGTLETQAQTNLQSKTEEADFMAAQIYRRLTVFTITAMILLMLVLIIFFRNIKRNSAYQQMLRKAKQEAENLAKAKETFVAIVSHEIRTPINAIYGLTEQMLQNTNTGEVRDDLLVVHKSAQHLISLVNDTLDFSKIESQKLKLEHVDFLPDEIFNEVLILNRKSAQAKGIDLIINNKERERVLKGDPVRLKQILINLVSNAIKFTGQGRVSLVSDYKETKDGLILLTAKVTDTGIGISGEDKDKIFEEFVQLDSDTTQKHRGAGLGLSIVKKLVELQNGEIRVDSKPGDGTTFTVEIPYEPGDGTKIKKGTITAPNIPSRIEGLHFLLVDDEEFNIHLLKNILKKWKVTFEIASNGKEALEKVSRTHFDLIFMDMRMPVMDGTEATAKILKLRPDARIVALTATNKPEDIRKSNEAGMLGLLQKPFTEKELLQIVKETLLKHIQGNEPLSAKKENPEINLSELERLTGGDHVFLKEMVELFIRSGEKCKEGLQLGLINQDWQEISDSAHKLAAPARHMMILPLYENLRKLENANGTEQSEVTRLVKETGNLIDRTNLVLKQKFGLG